MKKETFGFQESRLNSLKQQKPENYLTLSIIATIIGFCSCFGFLGGTVAIVLSVRSSTKFNKGDYQGAVKIAKIAKIISLIILTVFVIQLINWIYQIYTMGGWDVYTSKIREAVQKALEGGENR